MHVVLNSVVEPLRHDLWLLSMRLAILQAELLITHLHLVPHARQLVRRVDVGHNASVEHVLNIFEECFIDYLVIREDEHCFQLFRATPTGSIIFVSSDFVKLHQLRTEVFE